MASARYRLRPDHPPAAGNRSAASSPRRPACSGRASSNSARRIAMTLGNDLSPRLRRRHAYAAKTAAYQALSAYDFRYRRSARTASRCRSLRWRCRSGYSARHQPITRQRSLIPLAVRDAGAGWSWPHRYGGASRVRKSIVPPGCWAGGPGASALREGGLTGSPDECTIRACGSAVTGPAASAGLTRFAPSGIAPWRRRRRNAPSRVPPSPPACAPGRERDGRQRCRTAGVMTSPGGTRCWRRRCRSPVKATGIMRSLHRRRRSGGPGSRRWCVPGCRSRGAAGGPGSGSGCGGRPCA